MTAGGRKGVANEFCRCVQNRVQLTPLVPHFALDDPL